MTTSATEMASAPTGAMILKSFQERNPRAPIPLGARWPTHLWVPRADERTNGVLLAHEANGFTVYRSIVDRLGDGERFHVQSAHGAWAMTADEFAWAFPRILSTPSWQRGTPGAPGACWYHISHGDPSEARDFRVPRLTRR